MSWSGSTKFKATSEGGDAAAIRAIVVSGNESALVDGEGVSTRIERDTQASIAKNAAIAILDTTPFENAEWIGVSISGHTNPHHERQPGFSNESITVTVFQADGAPDLPKA